MVSCDADGEQDVITIDMTMTWVMPTAMADDAVAVAPTLGRRLRRRCRRRPLWPLPSPQSVGEINNATRIDNRYEAISYYDTCGRYQSRSY